MLVSTSEDSTADNSRRGLIVFLIFAFAIPWSVWFGIRWQYGPGGLGSPIAFLIAPAMVSLAGFAAALAQGGYVGLVAFARRTCASWPGLLALVAGPVLVLVAGLLTFLTHPQDLVGQGSPDPMIFLSAITLMNLWTGPIAEEFGWRGYFQPWLEERLPFAPAAILTGLVWAIWHLPLFLDSVFADAEVASGYTLWVVSWAVLLALVTRMARGNVIPAILLHFFLNSQADLFSAMMPRLDGAYLPSGMSLSIASFVVALAGLAAFAVIHRRKESDAA